MRIYGKIPVRFWTHPIIHDLSTDTKLIYLYFIAGPKTTLLGCFRVTIAEIAADLGWKNGSCRNSREGLSGRGINFL